MKLNPVTQLRVTGYFFVEIKGPIENETLWGITKGGINK